MTAVAGEITEDAFMGIVAGISALDTALSGVGAALIAAHLLEIARDSRTFSNKFGIAHALVLREIASISGDPGYIRIVDRNARTQRTEFALTEGGERLAVSVCG